METGFRRAAGPSGGGRKSRQAYKRPDPGTPWLLLVLVVPGRDGPHKEVTSSTTHISSDFPPSLRRRLLCPFQEMKGAPLLTTDPPILPPFRDEKERTGTVRGRGKDSRGEGWRLCDVVSDQRQKDPNSTDFFCAFVLLQTGG